MVSWVYASWVCLIGVVIEVEEDDSQPVDVVS